MSVNERQFKAYGYVRLGLYAVAFFVSTLFWTGLVLLALPRLFFFLRLFSNFFYFSFGLILLLSGLSAFWLVNRWLMIVPTSTAISPGGFTANAPFRREENIKVHFSELGTIFEFGFGTLVTVHLQSSRRNYRFIFGKDTDGYYRLIDTLKDGLNEFRATK